MDRKEFFKEAFRRTVSKGIEVLEKSKALNQFSEAPLKERPPGAHPSDQTFLSLCTGCDACMTACPVNVILIEDLEKRDPVIFPEKGPCIHCPGTPCITACPTGALSRNHAGITSYTEIT